MASRAARARMSAHDTTLGHADSNMVLALSITLKPLTPACLFDFFSAFCPSMRIEASHPYTKENQLKLDHSLRNSWPLTDKLLL